MSTRVKTADFLAAMTNPEIEAVPPRAKGVQAKPAQGKSAKVTNIAPTKAKPSATAERHHSRVDRKLFGGHLDAATLEIAAVLRVRLKMNNSELIKFALEELDRSHKAKRAFGDA